MKIVVSTLVLAALTISCRATDSPNADAALPPVGCVVNGVTVSPSSATVSIGDTLRASANFDDCPGPPRQHSYRWSSSNTTVAVVDSVSGLATARTEGAVTIIAELVEDRALKGAMVLRVTR